MQLKAPKVLLFLGIGSLAIVLLGVWYLQGREDNSKNISSTVPEHIQKAFDSLDKDRSGSISLQEFESSIVNAGKAIRAKRHAAWLERIGAQFLSRDKNKDGFIDQPEYRELVVIKQLGKKAPPLSQYDASKDERLDRDEYVNFRSQLLQLSVEAE